jgi:uncharacterized membrane protein YkoI
MKSLFLSLALSAGILCGVAAERITWAELPEPVKAVVMKEDHGEIRRIERDAEHGQALYKIEYDFRTRNKVLSAREDGTIVHETQVAWPKVPRDVQRAILDQGEGNPRAITFENRNGMPLYHVEFQASDHPLTLSQTGQVVSRGEPRGLRIPTSQVISRPAPRIPSQFPTQPKPAAPQPQIETQQEAGFAMPLVNARPVSFSDLPPAVQRTIQTQTGGAKIRSLQEGTLQGRTVYQVSFRDQEGEHTALRVSQNGAFLDQVAGADLESQPDQPQWDAQAWGGFALPLSEGRKVSWNELPGQVQKTVRSYSGDARIESINKGKLLGMTAYQAAFKPDGVHHELRVAEDGSFLEQSADGRVVAQSPLFRNRMAFLRKVPGPAQGVIQEQAGRSMIRAVQDQLHEGEQVYRVALEDKGRQTEFLVARDGRIVQGAIREAAGAEPGEMTRKITFDQLPQPVQQTVRTQVDVNRIEDIDERRRGGETRYEVGFKREDGTHVELLIEPTGRVLRIDEH